MVGLERTGRPFHGKTACLDNVNGVVINRLRSFLCKLWAFFFQSFKGVVCMDININIVSRPLVKLHLVLYGEVITTGRFDHT